MGLLDGYFDPEEFQASGLLGRLLSLPQMLGLYQSGMDFDFRISAYNGQTVGAQMSAAMPRTILRSNEPVVSPQTSLYRSAQDIPLDNYRKPQFGRTDVSPVMQHFLDDRSPLNACDEPMGRIVKRRIPRKVRPERRTD
ncbi:MAG: hypothetical protein ABIL01_20740 [Pseudomonadota bacterium]